MGDSDCSVADRAFGPTVAPACRSSFDFTLAFEQSILSVVPTIAILVAFIVRLLSLRRESVKTSYHIQRTAKLAVVIFLVGLQTNLLMQWAQKKATVFSIPSASLSLVTSLSLLVLSWLEDARTVRPSTTIALSLLVSIFCDLPQARTLWLLDGYGYLARLFTGGLFLKTWLLVLESLDKRHRLMAKYVHLPPESTSGIINRSLLWWLNPIFVLGYRKSLDVDDLPPLDNDLQSLQLKTKMQEAWSARRRPERPSELAWTLGRVMWRPMLAAVLPRLFLVALTFLQPLLIYSILTLITTHDDSLGASKGYALVAATGLIYTGLAVMSLHYNQIIHRCVLMSQSALIGLIYDRALLIPDTLYDEAEAVTLMSSDTDLIAETILVVHDCWVLTLQVAVGVYLLARQLGAVSIMPLVLVAGKSSHIIRHTR